MPFRAKIMFCAFFVILALRENTGPRNFADSAKLGLGAVFMLK